MNKPRVLVVDDENGPRQALRMLLKEEYDVALAQDVPNALDMLDQEHFELVITDIRMPKQSGVELLQIIKESRPETQVIILTGYAHLDTAMKAVEFGAFAYLEKPFDNDTMLRHVQAGLAKYRLEHERRVLERLAIEANRFETLGRLISGMIHDMGTPLTVVGSQIEIILNQPSRSDIPARLNTMHSQIKYCGEMVRSAMDVLREESRPATAFLLNDVVSSCLEIARPTLQSNRIKVEKTLSDDLHSIIGDPTLLRQAVLNLLTNACFAMSQQDGERMLGVSTWKDGDKQFLSVEDTGPGVPDEFKERVFETFFTTKGSKGTGLGLAVVMNVVRRHNGKVLLTDRPQGGAVFTLQLPIPSQEEVSLAFRQTHGGMEGPA